MIALKQLESVADAHLLESVADIHLLESVAEYLLNALV